MAGRCRKLLLREASEETEAKGKQQRSMSFCLKETKDFLEDHRQTK
jgi:hypothetical protein